MFAREIFHFLQFGKIYPHFVFYLNSFPVKNEKKIKGCVFNFSFFKCLYSCLPLKKFACKIEF